MEKIVEVMTERNGKEMNRTENAHKQAASLGQVDVIAQLADIKDQIYRNTLLITGLSELLMEKNLFTRRDLLGKVASLERELDFSLEQLDLFTAAIREELAKLQQVPDGIL